MQKLNPLTEAADCTTRVSQRASPPLPAPLPPPLRSHRPCPLLPSAPPRSAWPPLSSSPFPLPPPTCQPRHHHCLHRLAPPRRTGVRLSLSQSMRNLARADVRGLIIYITQSGGWHVTASKLSSTAPPLTLAGGPPPCSLRGGVGALRPQRGAERQARHALGVLDPGGWSSRVTAGWG